MQDQKVEQELEVVVEELAPDDDVIVDEAPVERVDTPSILVDLQERLERIEALLIEARDERHITKRT